MNVDAFVPWGLCVALLTVRLTVALALSPALASHGLPATVRVALVLALAALTFAYRNPLPAAAVWAREPAALLMPVLTEVLVGALLGLGVHVVMAALSLAGRLMDVQIGFALGSVFDPVTRSSSNVLGSLASLIGVTLFVTGGAHLQLAELISQSLDALPLGQMPPIEDPLQPLLAAGTMFGTGLALAAPVAIALLIVDLAVAVASRNMPQVNVLVLATPVKVVVGYAVLALTVAGWAPLLQRAFTNTAGALGMS